MTESAPVRNAVTLLLVRRDPLRVLMVHRGQVGAFAGALAFPGGVVDAEDSEEAWSAVLDGAADLDVEERARRVAVVRELFEETGLVLGATEAVSAPRDADVRAMLRESDVRVDIGDLRPVARWVTPEGNPKRFDTWFYVAETDGELEALADGVEIAGIEWAEPGAVARLAERGERRVMLPTLANLARLDESAGEWGAWADAFAASPDPVHPVVRVDEDGSRVAVIPESSGYRVREFPIG